ncbi:uncharacterized protein LOC130685692 isoform X1 [Daphnia carinata]|uniref:uncharacterized protein LOC130685692 isoform X1 n=1 Tax=Daphnia carinata TaxID=120202 RepID=UPI00257EEB65|nr:uncharacterized protein LOC130685692 isoform X1 [Daphnia carinata]
MSMTIPAVFLNVQIHSITNLALGALCFIFQIAALAVSPHDVYEQIGIGFWGGLILMFTAITAYKAATGEAPFLLGCSFVLSIFAFLTSFSIMCIFAASIDQMKRYSENPCTGYCAKVDEPISPCSHYSSAHLAFDSILLTCGLIGIPVNALLVLAVISMYNPLPASAPAT